MKFNRQFKSLLIRNPHRQESSSVHTKFPRRYLHESIPSGITWPSQWVMTVTLRCSHIDTPATQSLHRTQAHMSLLATLLPHVLRDKTAKRTHRTAVWLLRWQLHQCHIPLRHFRLYPLQVEPSTASSNPCCPEQHLPTPHPQPR